MQNQILLTSLSETALKEMIEEIMLKVLEQCKSQRSEELNSGTTDLLTRKEAAKLLHISLPTLDKLTDLQKFSAHRVGRKKLYSERELTTAIQSKKIKPSTTNKK